MSCSQQLRNARLHQTQSRCWENYTYVTIKINQRFPVSVAEDAAVESCRAPPPRPVFPRDSCMRGEAPVCARGDWVFRSVLVRRKRSLLSTVSRLRRRQAVPVTGEIVTASLSLSQSVSASRSHKKTRREYSELIQKMFLTSCRLCVGVVSCLSVFNFYWVVIEV